MIQWDELDSTLFAKKFKTMFMPPMLPSNSSIFSSSPDDAGFSSARLDNAGSSSAAAVDVKALHHFKA